ncbi:uncharacterized protein [Penaeus vannamei]|uniref:uncharacterized protein n=1 Tax=Penaeus vannamei TaxID=6689 RepID=UPI00387F4CBD
MRVVAAFVWAVAGAAWALEEGGVGSLYDQHFPPLHPNCTQSLTDLLLLRQESQLRESAGILKEILSEIKGSLARTAPSTEASCSGTFLKFGGTCLYLAKDVKKTWDAARTFCQDLGGDLAVFRDANALAEAIGYVKALGESFSSTVHVFLFIHVLINTFFISFEDDNGCYVMVMSQTTIIVPPHDDEYNEQFHYYIGK